MPYPGRVDQSQLISEIEQIQKESNRNTYKVFNLSTQIYDYGIFSGAVSEYAIKHNDIPPSFSKLNSMLLSFFIIILYYHSLFS